MGMPMRPDQVFNPPPAALAPSSQTGFFIGRRVVVFGSGTSFSGVFVYDPVPGAGNLIASIASAAGTDPYNNAYDQGITTYGPGSSLTQLLNGLVTQDDNAGDEWVLAPVSISGVTYYQFQKSTGTVATAFFNSSANLIGSPPGSAGNPETWHGFASIYGSHFTDGTPAARYRFEPVGSAGQVRFSGQIKCTATSGAGTTICTLPAGYRPSETQVFLTTNDLSGAVGSVTAALGGTIEVLSTGLVNIVPSASSGNVLWLDGVTFALD